MSLKILIHGDDITASRNYFFSYKKSNPDLELIQLNGEKITLSDLIIALESQSFWQKPKRILIENLFSRTKSKEQKELLEYTQAFNSPAVDLILWEKKEVTPAKLKKLKDWQIKKFKIPVLVFKILDSFIPNNTKLMLSYLQQSKNNIAPELVFYLLVRRIHELLVAIETGKSGLKGAPWQIGKIMSQAKKWPKAKLYYIYKQLLKAEYSIKKGKSPYNLSYHLDLLMLNL